MLNVQTEYLFIANTAATRADPMQLIINDYFLQKNKKAETCTPTWHTHKARPILGTQKETGNKTPALKATPMSGVTLDGMATHLQGPVKIVAIPCASHH